MARMGEREWYFFVPRDRRQAGGGRPNRTTERGFWKATGSDRPIRSTADPRRLIGLKKTLVYYRGRAPRGSKTDWVMNEYRLPDPPSAPGNLKEDIVLCKVYRKATSLKELEQRAAMYTAAAAVSAVEKASPPEMEVAETVVENEAAAASAVAAAGVEEASTTSTVQSTGIPEIEVSKYPTGLDWSQDPFAMPFSPWNDDPWSPYISVFKNY